MKPGDRVLVSAPGTPLHWKQGWVVGIVDGTLDPETWTVTGDPKVLVDVDGWTTPFAIEELEVLAD